MTDDSSLTRTPLLNPSYVPVILDENTVEFRGGSWSGPAFTLHDDSETGTLPDLLEAMDGTTTIRHIAEKLPESTEQELLDIVDHLFDNGLVIDDDGSSMTEATTRGYLAAHDDYETPVGERVSDTRVGIIGNGSLSQMVLDDVRSMGVKNVTMMDPAPGEENSSGSPQGEGVTFQSGCEELPSTVEQSDFLICALNYPRPELLQRVNELTYQRETQWLVSQIRGYDGVVGPTILPGRTACYECFRSRMDTTVDDIDRETAYSRQAADRQAPVPIPGFDRIIAGYTSTEALHQIADGVGFTVGRILCVNRFQLNVEVNDVLKSPRCSTCGSAQTSSLQRFSDIDQIIDE